MRIEKDKIYKSLRTRYLLTPNNPNYRALVKGGRSVVKRDRNLSTINFRLGETTVNGFTGDFAPGNWTINDDGNSPPVGSVLAFTSDLLNLGIGTGTPGDPYFVEACIVIPQESVVTFESNWNTFGTNYTVNGGPEIPSIQVGDGTNVVNASPGTVLCLRLSVASYLFGDAGQFFNFSVTTVSQARGGSVASPIGGKWVNFEISRDRNLHDVRVPNKSDVRTRG